VPIRTRSEDGFHLTAEALEAHVTSATRALLLNTPGNPTGAVLNRREIEAICGIAARHDFWIVSDEVYADLTFSGEFASPFDIPRFRDRSVAVSSVSKTHAMPGFRCGWAAGSQEFSDRLLPLTETMLFGSQPFLEDATAHALTHEFVEVGLMREAYRRRAGTVVSGLSNAPRIVARMPEGGMFIMVDVRRTGLTGEQFAMRLLDEERVVTMPGESFGEGGAGHLRIGLTAGEDELAEACRRICHLAERL
jgi:arginine:pyruvate transaminase